MLISLQFGTFCLKERPCQKKKRERERKMLPYCMAQMVRNGDWKWAGSGGYIGHSDLESYKQTSAIAFLAVLSASVFTVWAVDPNI